MAQASRDANRIPTLLGVSNVDGITPVPVYADPITHRLLIDSAGGGTGTVTDVSVVSANGFAGTVATSTTTPAITLSTTITGVLKGNGTAISAALNSDLPVMTATVGGAVPTPPNNTTTFLRGDGTFATPAGGGTVTSVSFTGGLISVATATSTPALTVAGTSGGVPYFSSASTWASSAALAANAIVIGGGAGVAPATTTTGTGVLTALGVNVGSAGAFITFNGAAGTPSSLVGTNITGTAAGLTAGTASAVAVGGITGLGTGVATALAVNVGSAGAFVTFNGALGTPSSGTLTNATGLPVAGITSSTSTALGVGSLELGNASDTTLSRSAAGVLAVEGVVIPSISSTNTLTNKRITRRTATTNAPGATPTTNSDNVDYQVFTGLATAITSMTTNLSGTPVAGDFLEFWLTDNGTARAITWGASFAATTVALPTTTVISTKLRVLFEWGGSTWDCVAVA